MDKESQLKFLVSSINERVESLNSRRLYYRRKSVVFFLSMTVISAFITVLLGLNIPDYKESTRQMALILSSISSVLSAISAFFNYKDLWLSNNNALNRFYELRFNIEFRTKGHAVLDQIEVEDFKKTYQAILNDLNSSWAKAKAEK